MSVEALVWAHQTVLTDTDDYDTPEELEAAKKRQLAEQPRLFSSGLNPYIMEWDTVGLRAQVCTRIWLLGELEKLVIDRSVTAFCRLKWRCNLVYGSQQHRNHSCCRLRRRLCSSF